MARLRIIPSQPSSIRNQSERTFDNIFEVSRADDHLSFGLLLPNDGIVLICLPNCRGDSDRNGLPPKLSRSWRSSRGRKNSEYFSWFIYGHFNGAENAREGRGIVWWQIHFYRFIPEQGGK